MSTPTVRNTSTCGSEVALLTYAYGVKPYQITGPDWMATTRFDIVAKMPEGSKKADAPKMLQTLLEDRFKLTTHRASAEHPVLALVVGKGGPKLKASAEKPVAIDESVPLKPGESKMEGPDGPVRVQIDMTTGSSVIDMGLQGKMSYHLVPATQSFHIDFSMTTMTGFADMITQLFAQLGGTGGKQVVDMTGIQGNYDATVELSLLELISRIWREPPARIFRRVFQADPAALRATHRRWPRIPAREARPWRMRCNRWD